MKRFEPIRVFKSSGRISARFRNINILLFIIVSALIVTVMFFVLSNITDTVSEDYARLYSANTVSALGTYLNGEIALVTKAARSRAVMEWFEDEENEEKKRAAHEEMIGIIGVLKSKNLYLGIEKTLHEFTVEEGFSVDDIEPFAVMEPGYYDDAWYFECAESDREYQLNVDVDKILLRKLVWLNYKVARDDEVLGVLCTGLEFSRLVEEMFSKYDNTKVRGLVIDENGLIHMDSLLMGENNFLHYEIENNIDDEFSGEALLADIKKHLSTIDGYFEESEDPEVIKLSSGPYSYMTIAPIAATTWSVITFYNSSSLFNMTKLIPLFLIMIAMFIIFVIVTGLTSSRLIFVPFQRLMDSIAQIKENNNECVHGTERDDEFGDLANTIQSMKDKLDSYNSDLEKEVAERTSDLKQAYEQVNEQHQIILSSIDYSSKIQKNLLPENEYFKGAFLDYSIIWKPKDIVGGDIYWLKNFNKGTLLCVCDCTGHGTPGALLTMLVVSTLDSIVNEIDYTDTAQIVWRLDQQLSAVLNVNSNSRLKDGQNSPDINDGCDMAALFISDDGTVKISSTNISVFICDGKEVVRIKGQRLYIGDGSIKNADGVKIVTIPKNPDNKFYISSDGLYDQMGDKIRRPFGYSTFERLILENHHETQDVILSKVWEAFENYRGAQARRDDLQVISFKTRTGA